MFLLNSRLGLFTAAWSYQAPLLPKLRGHFAEFLNKGSPVRLRILSSPTCVGLRYGHLLSSIAAFLASVKSMTSLLVFGTYYRLGLSAYGTLLIGLPLCLDELFHKLASSILLCHCFCQTDLGGIGISTDCPSPTAFALGLGPDLP